MLPDQTSKSVMYLRGKQSCAFVKDFAGGPYRRFRCCPSAYVLVSLFYLWFMVSVLTEPVFGLRFSGGFPVQEPVPGDPLQLGSRKAQIEFAAATKHKCNSHRDLWRPMSP